MTIVAHVPDVRSVDLAHASTPARTLADLLDAYRRDYLPHKQPKTQYQEGRVFDWIARELGSIPLAQLTPLVLRTWRDSWRGTYCLSTIRRYLTILSATLTAGVQKMAQAFLGMPAPATSRPEED